MAAVDGEIGLKRFFKDTVRPGDIFVCLGAGSISSWVNNLPKALKRDEHNP